MLLDRTECVWIGWSLFGLVGFCLDWMECVLIGGCIFELEGVCLDRRECVLIGWCVFRLDEVCLDWWVCRDSNLGSVLSVFLCHYFSILMAISVF